MTAMTMAPSHSHLIKTTILAEKNRPAVEIAFAAAALIAADGSGSLSITAQEIIDRCPALKSAMAAARTTAAKDEVLKHAFSKGWELLETQTCLSGAICLGLIAGT